MTKVDPRIKIGDSVCLRPDSDGNHWGKGGYLLPFIDGQIKSVIMNEVQPFVYLGPASDPTAPFDAMVRIVDGREVNTVGGDLMPYDESIDLTPSTFAGIRAFRAEHESKCDGYCAKDYCELWRRRSGR